MERSSITDLYQASYLLLSGCTLAGIECIPSGGAISCQMIFEGEQISLLMQDWWDKKAVANLWAFRSAYNQIQSYIHQAKRNYDQLHRKGSRV